MPEKISKEQIARAEQILIDNGVEEDEAKIVLQAIGYALLDEELYPQTFKISNIQWDKTDDNGCPVEADGLPHSLVLTSTGLGLSMNASMDEVEDAVSDWLSNSYGFCHQGFVLNEVEQ